jgi:ABC-type proline/glycine betaine transport system permease subunit
VAGLALSDTQMILAGAIPAAVLAFVVDGLLGAAERPGIGPIQDPSKSCLKWCWM